MRIDFVLTDKTLPVNGFKTYDVVYSDHYPVMAKVGL
jgi:endonuclease/exonuclease/phosphatase family metal-dependent hydrolase